MALAKYQKDLWDTVHTLEKKTKGDLKNDENFTYPKSNGTKGAEFEKILKTTSKPKPSDQATRTPIEDH